MELHVSLVGRRDLSGEIHRQLRQAILDGRLRPGDRLPASRDLARQLSVSRTTVNAAYDRLAASGLVTSRVGAGTFVREDVPTVRRPPDPVRREGALRPRAVWQGISMPTALVRPARFDFRSGLPDARLFPYATWRRLTALQLRARTAGSVVLGDPAGQPELRDAIARHIAISRGVLVTADDVIVTNGTQQAVDLLARVLVGPGDRVAVEDPGYPPPRLLLASQGARVVGVPVDREGLVVEAVPPDVRLVCVTPSHQYPMGMPMSLSRREALLAWAERNDAAIIEDDYDTEFRFGGRPIEPLRALDQTGRVAYLGSFSKTLLPGLRLGFVVAPPSLREALHRAKYVSDWSSPLFTQLALARFIDEGGFARHLRKMNRVYRTRWRLMTTCLRRDFAEHLEVVPSEAGLHLTATARSLPADTVLAVLREAREIGVHAQALSRFGANGPAQAGVVLGYGSIRTAEIETGLGRLKACFDAAAAGS